ncbi:UDP-N-acetylmuramoyl-tripeptide--D-alanyl-D-alanine ligase [Daejeonella oryzae]|uniref:UDP-N-acetylmuramoyl-tripeptide--D-alanyl-D- alanine ligase n=1 Tax=Daejeonella oryzae TaxID=1122943 RepID=UPI0004115302|nr:UDP-N-acetylmuramoyl-tripeptide--D-alanyl-D-alanine ligase [Daejeonella oryzae]
MNIDQLYQVYLNKRVICTDTRQITAGCLFFALKGENFDGNKFALQALNAGAAYAVIDDEQFKTNDRFILVDDVLTALQDLARHHRRQLKIPFIGITGSNGKTTTKELLYSVLSQHCKTHATSGNLNNHIGVPLTILSIPEKTDIAIIEMGANHQKEIEFLCSIAEPTHGIITNVGKAHLEGFGGFEGVKIAKGELYDYMQNTRGTVFVNSDNFELVDMLRERTVEKIVSYGKTADNFVSGSLLSETPFLEVAWHREAQEIDDKTHISRSNLSGTYNFENILAVICIGTFFKLSAEQINAGIELYNPVNNRSQIKNTDSNMLICDYYNANPSSMLVAIDNLNAAPGKNKVMILGDMFELGSHSSEEHAHIIAKAESVKAQKCIFVGEEFYKHQNNTSEFYRTTQDAYDALKKDPVKDSSVLIKGSRGMKLETLLDLL